MRLRFRAGLLRLGDRGAIEYRPSLTTSEVRALLGSDTFDHLAGTFEHVAYGGQPAEPPDVAEARTEWPRVVKEGASGTSDTRPRPTRERRRPSSMRRRAARRRGEPRRVGARQRGRWERARRERPGSSYATSEGGLAAYAQLLADYGHPVQRVRGDLATAELDPTATLIVTSGDGAAFLEPDDVDGIAGFVRRGGRAVLVELPPSDLQSIAGVDPEVVDGVRDYRRVRRSPSGRSAPFVPTRPPRTTRRAT